MRALENTTTSSADLSQCRAVTRVAGDAETGGKLDVDFKEPSVRLSSLWSALVSGRVIQEECPRYAACACGGSANCQAVLG
jgi:hypothetical protein